jgi:hypothetical protein
MKAWIIFVAVAVLLATCAQVAMSQCVFCYEQLCFDSDTNGYDFCLPGCTLGERCAIAM